VGSPSNGMWYVTVDVRLACGVAKRKEKVMRCLSNVTRFTVVSLWPESISRGPRRVGGGCRAYIALYGEPVGPRALVYLRR
jgi:hypothetical protein